MESLIQRIYCLLRQRIKTHLLFWIVFYVLFFLMILIQSPASFSLKFTTGLIVPLLIPVYLHFLALQFLLENKRYIFYGLAVIAIIIASEWISSQFIVFVFQDDFSTYLSLPLIIVSIVLTSSIKYLKKAIFHQKMLNEIKEKQNQTELELLKSQVNPHFLFNTLNNIYALALTNSENTADSIMKLSDLMRYNLNGIAQKEVLLSEEVEYIKSYIELEKLRMSFEHHIDFNIDPNIEKCKIIPMLLTPLVENAFKHGIDSKTKTFNLNLKLEVSEQMLTFKIRNSIAQNKTQEKSGRGLTNLTKRLALSYPEKHRFKTKAENGFFKAILEIEL